MKFRVAALFFVLFFFILLQNVKAVIPYQAITESTGLDTWDTTNALFDRTDEAKETIALPFAFDFFDKNYVIATLTSNGILTFTDIGFASESSEVLFQNIPMIAPLWDNLITVVYKNEYSDRVVFTWDGYYAAAPIRLLTFQVVLYKNKDIRIRYGTIQAVQSTVIAGISAGNKVDSLRHTIASNTTIYYKYGLPPPPPAGRGPQFSAFNVSSKTVKRSQQLFLNVTIADDVEVDANSLSISFKSPTAENYLFVPRRISGTSKSGVYQVNWTVLKNATSGVYKVFGFACDTERNCNLNIEIGTFTVNGTIIIDTLVKPSYNLTHEISLTGRLFDAFNKFVPNADLTLTVSAGVTRYSTSGKSFSDGRFEIKLRTTLSDPVGKWTLEFKAKDADGNEGTITKDITLVQPPGVSFYNVVYLNPVADSTYFRGENLRVSTKLLDIEQPVANANVFLKLPTGERIQMNEVSPGVGIYQTNYRIKYSDFAGNWSIVAEGTKETDKGLIGGARLISFQVRPVDLKIELLDPSANRFSVGQTSKIRVKVTYPDGTPASGIVVNATPVQQSVILAEKEKGIFESQYSFTSADIGRYPLRIFASDANDNLGFIERTIFVEQPTIFDFAARYWYVTLGILAIIGYQLFKIFYPMVRGEIYATELQRLLKLKKDTQRKYFVESGIERETFERIIDETSAKMIEVKAKIDLLKKAGRRERADGMREISEKISEFEKYVEDLMKKGLPKEKKKTSPEKKVEKKKSVPKKKGKSTELKSVKELAEMIKSRR